MKFAPIVLASGLVFALSAHAQQAKKPVYLIADLNITDAKTYADYGAKAAKTVADFHGRILARGKPEAKEGSAPGGVTVVVTFDSKEEFEKWWGSPEYRALVPERQKSATGNIYVVEGSQ